MVWTASLSPYDREVANVKREQPSVADMESSESASIVNERTVIAEFIIHHLVSHRYWQTQLYSHNQFISLPLSYPAHLSGLCWRGGCHSHPSQWFPHQGEAVDWHFYGMILMFIMMLMMLTNLMLSLFIRRLSLNTESQTTATVVMHDAYTSHHHNRHVISGKNI